MSENFKEFLAAVFIILFVAAGLELLGAQEFHGEVELGIITSTAQLEYDVNNYEFYEHIPYANIDLYYELMFIRLGGSVLTYMFDQTDDITFYPIFTEYGAYAEVYFHNFTLGFEHMCGHEVVGSAVIGTLLDTQIGYNKFYIRGEF